MFTPSPHNFKVTILECLSILTRQATPQQNDVSSSGPIVVRNTGLQMNSFFINNWNDRLDAKYLRMETVKVFEACVLDNALQKLGSSGKSSSDSEKSAWS